MLEVYKFHCWPPDPTEFKNRFTLHEISVEAENVNEAWTKAEPLIPVGKRVICWFVESSAEYEV